MPAAKPKASKNSGKAGEGKVDAYIAGASKPIQPMLRQLRALIKAAAPKATERVSYGMPFYEQGGRVIYLGAFKNHVSLFLLGEAKHQYADQLKKYWTEKATQVTLRLPIDEPLPSALITKLVKGRVKELEAGDSQRPASRRKP
jgi:uncharacterized protein YdhG (YjbR/CyaY superfamily)